MPLRSLITRLALAAALILPLAACHEDFNQLSAPRPVAVARPAPPPPVVVAPPVVAPAAPIETATLADPLVPLSPTTAPAAPGQGSVVVIPSSPAPQGESPLLAQQRAACAREGGRLQSLTGGNVSCIRQTRDAGQACTGAGACEGACLARSGTCAPITPLFGCHEVLLAPGSTVTQCVE